MQNDPKFGQPMQSPRLALRGVLSPQNRRSGFEAYQRPYIQIRKKALRPKWVMALDYQMHAHVSKPLLPPPNSFRQGSF